MGNTEIVETPIVGDALRRVAALLPARWTIREEPLEGRRALFADSVVTLGAPNGIRTRIAVEAKRSGRLPGQVVVNQLRNLQSHNDLPVLFVTDYIGPTLRAALEAEGLSYADATGWVRLVISDPPVLITGRGADRAPNSTRDASVRRLNGLAVNRSMRALVNAELPVGVRELAARAGSSPGSVAKLLATLTAESIVDRSDTGAVVGVRKRALIDRWARDYSFAKTNDDVGYYIAPRGLQRTLDRIRESEWPTVLTGSAAARELIPDDAVSVVPLRLLALYTRGGAEAAAEYGLIPAEPPVANVAIAAPQDPRILDSAVLPPRLAPIALVLADLLTLPGRGDAEAEQLMKFLASTDPSWAV